MQSAWPHNWSVERAFELAGGARHCLGLDMENKIFFTYLKGRHD